MKKVFTLCLICLLALSLDAQTDLKQVKTARDQDRKAELELQGYVDLGLPSGTLWKDKNEEGGFYTFVQALSTFGNSLPNREQMEELKNSCKWIWSDNGYKVVGPNGKSIFLPAASYRDCNWDLVKFDDKGYYAGLYWSSSRSGSDSGYSLGLNPREGAKINDFGSKMCYGLSVRLVAK